MKENKEIEKILLNDQKYDALVKEKIEREFIQELNRGKTNKIELITNIKDAPKSKLFSKFATYMIINKTSKTQSYINGVQAEGFLGTQTTAREQLISGESDSFVSGNNYIKFVKVKV